MGVSRGGLISFSQESVGGTARVELFGNGHLEMIYHNGPSVTIGSLEGDGYVLLGGYNLTVGTNNLSTTFSGAVNDSGSLTKIGTGTLTLSGKNAYNGGTIVNGGGLLVDSYSGTGSGGVTVNNSGSVFGGTGAVRGPVTINAGAAFSVGDRTTPSGTLIVQDSVTLNSGAIIQLVVGPLGAHSTLFLPGGGTFASNQAFDFIDRGAQPGLYAGIITELDGDPGSTPSWTITTPGFAGTFSYHPGFGKGSIDLTITAAPTVPPTTLGNISTRLRVETGDNLLIGGFIVTGTQPKRVIMRAIGPSLPLAGTLANPILELRDSLGGLIRSNDNWRNDQESEIMATGIPPSDDLESAIVETLPANGAAYTAIVHGANNGTGIAVVEAFDLDQTLDSKLANISTRGLVQAGDDAMIAGTIVLGQASQRVLVRAIGPSLPVDGKLEDPTLELRDSNGTLIRANDNWRSDQEAEIMATTIPPSNDLESAIVATLPAGGAAYTAIVRGVNNTSGVALVEIYGLD